MVLKGSMMGYHREERGLKKKMLMMGTMINSEFMMVWRMAGWVSSMIKRSTGMKLFPQSLTT